MDRHRVAAIVISGDRALLRRAGADDFWAMPGGEVEAGETEIQSLARELLEELGVAFAIGALLWSIDHVFEYHDSSIEERGRY
jgi:8-oxo-dGTP pyrophosphatase MutT (NUDIX family)